MKTRRSTDAVRGTRSGNQVKALLSLGLLAGFGAVSTLAAWTGGATATSTIGAGTVAIGVGATGPTVEESYTFDMGTNWYPGLSKTTMITVKNTGTLAARYKVSGAIADENGEGWGAAMAVQITTGASCEEGVLLQKDAGSEFDEPTTQASLAAGEAQTLCVEYSLLTNAPTTLQGKSTTITLRFTATVGVSS